MAGAATAAGAGVLGVTAQDASPAAEVPEASVSQATVDAAVAALPGIVEELMASTGVPGIAVSVIYNDELQYADGFGVREVGVDGNVDADTVFQLASVSKPLASTVVASMVGEGAFTWDTPLADLNSTTVLSDAWVSGKVTLADLFSHRSGLPGHVLDAFEDLGADRETVLHALRHVELTGDFRSSYAYTNFGLTAAAVAAANFTGTTWEEASATRLYTPAGMTRTTSVNAEFIAMDNRAVGHVEVDGNWEHLYDRQPDAQSPAGGVSSSVTDLAQWLRLQLNGGELDGVQIVDNAALQTTHVPHAISNPATNPSVEQPGFYGLGWNVSYSTQGEVQLGHSGAFALGAGTTVYIVPMFGLGIAVLTNAYPIGVAESVALSFLDLCRFGEVRFDYLSVIRPIIEASAKPEFGAGVANPPAEVRPPAAPESYLGTYENDVFGPLEVVEDGEHLAIIVGPAGMQFPLAHYSRDVFTWIPPGENGESISAVTFTLGPDGLAEQVVLENLNLYNAGTFTRPVDDDE
jgi:CubicO group peptidase (beta-lactamase class C family)